MASNNIKKLHRKKLLVEFFGGLKIDNTLTASLNEISKRNEINTYYDGLIRDLRKVKTTNNKNHDNYQKALIKFNQKKYWQRKVLEVKEKNNLEALKIFDENLKTEVIENEKVLMEKYPTVFYTEEDSLKAIEKINSFEDKRQKELSKLENKQIKSNEKIVKNNEKLTNKISKLEEDIGELELAISLNNENILIEEKKKLAELLEKVKQLEDGEEKDNLQIEITTLQNKEKMIEDEKIQLSVNNLKMYFGGVKAVDDLSFEVYKGEIFGLIGPNGAGKTTVFNCVTQFYKSNAGGILFHNKQGHVRNLMNLKTHDIITEGISRSFQNIIMIWELNILDNMLVAAHSMLITNYFDHAFGTKRKIKEETVLKTKALKILEDLELLQYAYRFPHQLAYGVLKKVELARTLMTNPSLIILDEPAAGLNEVETIELAKTIKNINKKYGATIFLVEHDMGLVMSISDRILAISFGKKLALGTPKEVQNNEQVRIAYLGDDE